MNALQLLHHSDTGTPWPDETRTTLPTALSDATALALAVRGLRMARGERPAGFKIGFTNRTIWPRYGVYAPVWGTVWDTTLVHAKDRSATLSLAPLCQPRLEPEAILGIRAVPPHLPTLEQLFDCVEWVAPGFEIVQTHCPGWRFSAAETVADSGLHGRLLVGPQRPVRALAGSGAALDALLAACRVRLLQGERVMDEGSGANVLDGPLHALLHFVHTLQQCPGAPSLREGDVVTTGTWTDAFPLEPGQVWRAEFGDPLGPMQVEFR
jgi:2-keto-4-pentenoate hydratase